MVLEPVEVLGYTLGVADKVIVQLDDGTDMGSLHGPFEGSNNRIPYGLLVGDSLLNPSDGSFYGFSDFPPERALLGDTNEEAGYSSNSWILFESFISFLGNHF